MGLMPLKPGAKIHPPLIDGLLGHLLQANVDTQGCGHLVYWICFFSQSIQAPANFPHCGLPSNLFSPWWGGRSRVSSPLIFHGTLELRSHCQEWGPIADHVSTWKFDLG